ncbi:TPA: hypothetical protein ACG3P3_001651 [Clostridioides difficile]
MCNPQDSNNSNNSNNNSQDSSDPNNSNNNLQDNNNKKGNNELENHFSIVLDLHKEFFVSEENRRSSINNKANLILVIIIGFLGFSSFLDFPKLQEFKNIPIELYYTLLTTHRIGIGMLFFTLGLTIFTALPNNYMVLNFDDIYKESINPDNTTVTLLNFTIEHYNATLKNNAEINEKRFKSLRVVMYFLLLSIVLICFSQSFISIFI